MKKILFVVVFCFAFCVMTAQAQTPSADGAKSINITCPAGQKCDVVLKVKAKTTPCPACPKFEEPTPVMEMSPPVQIQEESRNKISDKLVIGLRGNGLWAKIPGTGETDDFLSLGGEGVLQLRNFLGPGWGVEFSTGFGAGWYPNSERVFYAQTEGGILWHPGSFEMMLGYNAGIGSTTGEVVLHRHTGVLRARYFFLDRLGLELSGQYGWGRQAWDIGHENLVEVEGEPFWDTYEETIHYSGETWGVGAGLLWRW